MKLKWMSLTVAIAVAAALIFINPQSVTAASSGSCGANATWSLSADGILTVSGAGAMTDYVHADGYPPKSSAPWADSMESIRSVVIGEGITHVGEFAFFGATNLSSVSLPSTLLEIGGHSFQNNTSLTTVVLPDKLQYIGSYAFSGANLKEISLPKTVAGLGILWWSASLEKIHVASMEHWLNIAFGPRDFSDKEAASPFYSGNCQLYIGGQLLTKAVIPQGTERIREYAFFGLEQITAFSIPSSVSEIGDGAFWGCEGLTEAVIPDTVNSVGGKLFMECKNLKSAKLPEHLQVISPSVFCGCSNLTDFTMPYNINNIGNNAFEGCEKLTHLNETNDLSRVYWIGSGAFNGCKSLAFGDLTLSDQLSGLGVSYSGYAFARCEGLTGITISGNFEYLTWSAFENCINLKKVVIKDGLKHIGSSAFALCTSLEEAVIPASVNKMDNAVFYGCANLKKVSILSKEIEFGPLQTDQYGQTVHILGIPGVTTVYCHPGSAVESYAKQNGFATAPLERTCANGFHQYQETVKSKLSCTESGSSVFDCSGCGESREETVYAEGHKVVNGTCTVCGGKFVAAGKKGNFVWHIDGNGVLEVIGDRPDMMVGAPWTDYADRITKMVMGKNVITLWLNGQGEPDQPPVTYPNLKSLEIGKDAEQFLPQIMYAPQLETITVSPENVALLVRDGVLYSRGGQTGDPDVTVGLVLYPAKKAGESFTIPQDVTYLYTRAFAGASGLKTVRFSAGRNVLLEKTAFAGCDNLAEIHILSKDFSLSTLAAVHSGEHLLGDPKKVMIRGIADTQAEKIAAQYGYAFEALSGCEATGSHGATVLKDQKDATCQEPGYTGDIICTVCEAVVTAGQTVPAAGHSMIKNAEVEAGCTAAGTAEFWHCQACGKDYLDEKGEKEAEELTLPPLGHNWSEGVEANGVVTYTCKRCSETKQLALPPKGMDVQLPEGTDALQDKVLTEEEKALVRQGQTAEVFLEVSDITENITLEEKELVQQVLEDATVGVYLDINLFKQIGEMQQNKVTNTNGAVSIVIQVPEELQQAQKGITRTYWVIRVHEGVAEKLPGVFDAETGAFTFETDRFSTYALVYEDVEQQLPDVPVALPRDPSGLWLWIAAGIAVAAGGAVAVILLIKKKKA